MDRRIAMIISKKHKFIFIHVPKNGGQSIVKSLLDYCDVNKILKDTKDINTQTWGKKLCVNSASHPLYDHSTSSKVKNFFDNNDLNFEEYFVFSLSRNPWAREVSMYNYIISSSNKSDFWGNKCKLIKQIFPSFRSYILKQQETFKETGSYSLTEGTLPASCHWNEFTNEIYKLEDGQKSINKICERIGIEPFDLLHVNKTKHKHYTKYYDEETKQIVAEKYAKDIEYFGYKFGE
jgi:hypothetical protein